MAGSEPKRRRRKIIIAGAACLAVFGGLAYYSLSGPSCNIDIPEQAIGNPQGSDSAISMSSVPDRVLAFYEQNNRLIFLAELSACVNWKGNRVYKVLTSIGLAAETIYFDQAGNRIASTGVTDLVDEKELERNRRVEACFAPYTCHVLQSAGRGRSGS